MMTSYKVQYRLWFIFLVQDQVHQLSCRDAVGVGYDDLSIKTSIDFD